MGCKLCLHYELKNKTKVFYTFCWIEMGFNYCGIPGAMSIKIIIGECQRLFNQTIRPWTRKLAGWIKESKFLSAQFTKRNWFNILLSMLELSKCGEDCRRLRAVALTRRIHFWLNRRHMEINSLLLLFGGIRLILC